MNISERSTAFPLISRRAVVRGRGSKKVFQWSWFKPLEKIRSVLSELALMSAGPSEKRAEAVPSRTPFSASLSVVPSIAAINTPRLLTITAYFPLGCGPTDAAISTSTVDGVQFLDVRLDKPNPDFAFCDLVLVPYAVELTFTPSAEGDLPVRIVTSDDIPVGVSVVITRGKGDDAEFDVTGKWIDPASNATGLALVSDDGRHEHVVGTWNFQDHEGVSRRYAIAGVHWKQPDVEAEGAIYETTSSGAVAPSPDLPIPLPLSGSNANQLGLARITFHGRDCARIFALGFGGNVLFTSNLVRTTF